MRNADENPGPDGIFVETGSYRLVNDGSAWSTVVTSDGALGLPTIDALNRTAEGDYAGLSAYLVLDHEVGMFEGAIIPGSYPEVRSTRDPRPAIVTQPDARGGGEDVRAPPRPTGWSDRRHARSRTGLGKPNVCAELPSPASWLRHLRAYRVSNGIWKP